MGVRKRNYALALKESKKTIYAATLKNCPISPKKAVLIADLVRGMDVEKAMAILQNLNKGVAIAFYQLVKSAAANFYTKTGKVTANLKITSIVVNQGMTLKRIQPAPQGRAHRILKRYSHIRVIVGEKEVMNNTKKVATAIEA